MANGPKRTRRRNTLGTDKDKRTEIANRVIDFYNEEDSNREDDRNARLQRYAKYRMWQQGTNWPWPDAADTAVPDMFQDSNRIQDTLHNAVMSQRPPVVAKAIHKHDANSVKEEMIDDLIQHQVFREQPGERILGELIHNFINDPAAITYTPWVRDKQKTADVTIFDPIPEDVDVKQHLFEIVRTHYPDAMKYDPEPPNGAGWDWKVEYEDKAKNCTVKFYTNEVDQLEMMVEMEKVVYDGPCVFVKDYDDVIFPQRSANLQPPSPSNPGGAPFVILRDFPTVAEVKTLIGSKYYDLPSKEDEAKIDQAPGTTINESESQEQKDLLSGHQPSPGGGPVKPHRRLTRLYCFDTDDIDGDGKFEQVIYWVILETKTLLKARLLSDMFPGSPPRRPLDSESFIPVPGRVAGISLLETMEAVHDIVKVLADQAQNSNDLSIASPGFYRPSGGANPEVYKVEPYSLIPLQNPQQDVTFPPIGNPQAMGMALNLLTLMDQWQGKTTMIGDLQFGNIPPGGSSGLRTIGNMAMMMGQGEARPERILRRFFMLLVSVWGQIHRLNQSFLPKMKQFRVSGAATPNSDPYRQIKDKNELSGEYQFEFAANVFNTSKAALQQGLGTLLQTFVNDLTLQLGIVTPENIYRLMRDYARAQGQDADRYLTPPTAEASMERILAEEALTMILRNTAPVGIPLEPGGWQEHHAKLMEFVRSENVGVLGPEQTEMLKAWLATVEQGMGQQIRQQQTLAAAQAFSQSQGGGGGASRGGAPPQSIQKPGGGPPRISGPSEMMNEAMPTAGGGANGRAA